MATITFPFLGDPEFERLLAEEAAIAAGVHGEYARHTERVAAYKAAFASCDPPISYTLTEGPTAPVIEVGASVCLPSWEPDRHVIVEWVGDKTFAGWRSSDGVRTHFGTEAGWRLWTAPSVAPALTTWTVTTERRTTINGEPFIFLGHVRADCINPAFVGDVIVGDAVPS